MTFVLNHCTIIDRVNLLANVAVPARHIVVALNRRARRFGNVDFALIRYGRARFSSKALTPCSNEPSTCRQQQTIFSILDLLGRIDTLIAHATQLFGRANAVRDALSVWRRARASGIANA
jgi:hypothetical protein